MSTEEKPQIPKELQKISLGQAQEVPEEKVSRWQGSNGPNSHQWGNKMEVQHRLSGKPDLEIEEKKPVLFVDDEQYSQCPVDFKIIQKMYDDEEILEETVKIVLEEIPKTKKLLAEAVEAGDSENVKMYAHKLKGSARHVAAVKLIDMLHDLEIKGREGFLEGSKALFADIQTEFYKLISFLSQPNWIETAKGSISGKVTP